MGDRRNIIVREKIDAPGIYFYSHWGGQRLSVVLAGALKRGKDRWNDSSYLNRIIFSDMIKNKPGSLTGVGISLELMDTDYSRGGELGELCVCHNDQTVHINGQVWSFQEFTALADEDLMGL